MLRLAISALQPRNKDVIIAQIHGLNCMIVTTPMLREYTAQIPNFGTLLLTSSSSTSQVTQGTNYTLMIANCHMQRREIRLFLRTVRLSAHRIETDFLAEPSRST